MRPETITLEHVYSNKDFYTQYGTSAAYAALFYKIIEDAVLTEDWEYFESSKFDEHCHLLDLDPDWLFAHIKLKRLDRDNLRVIMSLCMRVF